MNNTQTPVTVNKVTNLRKRYSWEYMYQVQGAIFTLEQCPYTNLWNLTGYASKEHLQNLEPFLQEASSLKRHHTSFLKYTFDRSGYGI